MHYLNEIIHLAAYVTAILAYTARKRNRRKAGRNLQLCHIGNYKYLSHTIHIHSFQYIPTFEMQPNSKTCALTILYILKIYILFGNIQIILTALDTHYCILTHRDSVCSFNGPLIMDLIIDMSCHYNLVVVLMRKEEFVCI